MAQLGTSRYCAAIGAGCLVVLSAGAGLAADHAPRVTGHVVYTAPGIVYLDRGSEAGLKEGAEVEVHRGGRAVATAEVTSVTAKTALAVVRSSERAPFVRDEFTCEGAPPAPPSPPARKVRPVAPMPGDEVPRAWLRAISDSPLPQVRYIAKPGDVGGASYGGEVETEFDSRAGMDGTAFWGPVQQLYLWAEGRDVWVAGLGFTVRGETEIRYDSRPDRDLPDRRVIPLLRQASFQFEQPRGGPIAAAGRFNPLLRPAGVVDGGQVGWQSKLLGVAAFGGLSPAPLDLAPRAGVQVFGAAFMVRPEIEHAHIETSVGYLGANATAGIVRQAVTLDNALTSGRSFQINQTATIDFLQGGGTQFQDTGVGLSDLAVYATARVSDRVSIEGQYRYENQKLFVDDATGLTAEWIAALQDRADQRARLAAKISLNGGDFVKPYVFGEQNSGAASLNGTLGAAGALYHLESVAGSTVSLDVAGDYGYGTRQQANVEADVSVPWRDRMRIGAGLRTSWTMDMESYLNALTYIPHVMLDVRSFEDLHLWLYFSAGVDHHQSWMAAEVDAWYLGRAGVGYAW